MSTLAGYSGKIEKSFRNTVVEGNISFCFLEDRATTLPCYHMSPWYTTHMVLEWYAIKIGINRLEIDWKVIFESISTKYSKWLIPPNQYIFLEITLHGYVHFLKILYQKFSLYLLFTVKSSKLSTLTPT